MNRPILFLLFACLLLGSACAPVTPRAPYSGQYSGASQAAYNRGYQLGFQDGRRGREDDHERYHYEYTEATERAFERGYDLGYETGEDQADADDDDRDRAKNEGYDSGRTDAENGLSPFYQRHRGKYTQETESSFRNGYVKGYKAGREDEAPVGLRRAYDDGYRQGEYDVKQGRPARPESFNSSLSSDEERLYMEGYHDGYRHAVPKY